MTRRGSPPSRRTVLTLVALVAVGLTLPAAGGATVPAGDAPAQTADSTDLRSITYGETRQGAVGPDDRAGSDIPNYYEPVTFTGTAGDVVTVDVVSAEVTVYLRLVAPDGEVVAQRGYQGTDTPRLAAVSLPQSGEYTIEVYGDDNDGTYAYSLSLRRADGAGQVGPVTADDAPFVVESTTRGAEFDYQFTVDGTVSKATVGERGSEPPDTITDNGDGTVTVTGFAGNLYGDGYVVDGDIRSFEKTGGDSGYRLELDGEDVTEQLTGSPAPDGERFGAAPIPVSDAPFVVESTTRGAEFDYRFTVEGTVSKAAVGERRSEPPDTITDNGDGTVTVTGFAGNLYGDGYIVDGEIRSFEKTGGDSGYRLELDGEDVTAELSGDAGGTDSPADADLGSLSYGETGEGAIGPDDRAGSDIPNYYEPVTFAGEAGDVVTIDVLSAEVPAYLRLVAPDGTVVAEAGYDGDRAPEIYEYQLAQSGEYTIEVYGDDNLETHAYTLSLDRVDRDVDLGSLSYGETGSATIGPGDSAGTDIPNFYEPVTFTGEAGDVVTASVLSAEVNAYLQLVDPDGVVVANDGYDGGLPEIRDHRLAQSGEYTIRVYGDENPEHTEYTLSLARNDTGDSGDSGSVSADNAQFVVESTAPDAETTYSFTVDGTVSRAAVGERDTEGADRITENDDGTVTVTGVVGNLYGDGYVVDGDIRSFELTGGDSDVRLELGGEDVTEALTGSPAPDGERYGPAPFSVADGNFVVESTTDGAEFDYRFTVEGTVSKAAVGERGSEPPDTITDNGDGTVTVTGFAGNLYGDGYIVDGDLRSFEKTGGDSGYRLELDGANVTAELTG